MDNEKKVQELIEAMVSDRDLNKRELTKKIEQDLKSLANEVKEK